MTNKDLTTSPILKTLFEMAFPMSWGILSIIGFNIVDTYFIGQLGKEELAAIALTFPVIMLFFSLALGIGVSVSSLVARHIGSKDMGRTRIITTDSLVISFIIVIICTIFGFITIDPVFKLLGAKGNTLTIARDYMEIWYTGMIFLTIPMVGNGAIRALGQMKVASSIMIISALLNMFLDPIFIFGLGSIPAMGVKGAALASVIARSITFLASLYFLNFRFKLIDLSGISFARLYASFKEIMPIAIPACGGNFLTPIAMGVITALIARLGHESMATYAIVNRIESFALVFILAISSSIGPLVGQNFGAQKMDRIKRAIFSSFFIAFLWSTFMAFIFMLTPKLIMSIFIDDPNVIKMGVWYFQIVPITYGFYGMRLIVNSTLNAVNRPVYSVGLTLINLLFIFIPLVYIGINLKGLQGVFYAQAFSNLAIGIISFLLVKNIVKKNGEVIA